MLNFRSNAVHASGMLIVFIFVLGLVSCGNKKTENKEETTSNINAANGSNITLKEKEIDGKPIENYLNLSGADPTVLAYIHGNFEPVDNPETLNLVDTLIHQDGDLFPLYFSCFLQICKEADNKLADALGPYAIEMLVGKTQYTVEKLSKGAPDYFTGLIANELYKKDDWQSEFDNIKQTLDANIGSDPQQKKELDQLIEGIQNDLDHLIHKK